MAGYRSRHLSLLRSPPAIGSSDVIVLSRQGETPRAQDAGAETRAPILESGLPSSLAFGFHSAQSRAHPSDAAQGRVLSAVCTSTAALVFVAACLGLAGRPRCPAVSLEGFCGG